MTIVLMLMAAVAVSLSGWLWPASVHIINWTDEGPHRVAVFAPMSRLLVTVVLTAAAAALVWLWPTRSESARRVRIRIVAPLMLVGLCAIPYLPWLPDRIPLLLIFAGPIKWVVAAIAVSWSIERLAAHVGWSATMLPTPSRTTIFIAALVVYTALGLRSLGSIGLKGDEPHYLIISHSLLADGDLKIENNHRQRDYRAFTREDIPPDYMQRGSDGEIYSIHAPGLPALLVPAYAVLGQYGALLMLCVFGALAALAVYDLAALTARPNAAVVTWAAMAFAVPFAPYAWAVFPEMPGAVIVAWAAVWIAQKATISNRRWCARGVVLALLPWLHTKFVVFLVALTAILVLVRLRTHLRAALALIAPIALSGLAWLGSFYLIYGVVDPQAPYGNFVRDWVKTEFVPRGLFGLVVDQKFGLLPYAPIYLLVPVGLALASRNAKWRWLAWSFAFIFAGYAFSSARLYMWWGGYSAPARFLVPALPLLTPALAVAIGAILATRWRLLIGVLIALSSTMAIVPALMPEKYLLFSEAHGVSRLAQSIQGSAPLTATLPTFTESQWQPRDLVPRGYPADVKHRIALEGRLALIDAGNTKGRAYDYRARRSLGQDEWRRVATITRNFSPESGSPPLPAEGLYLEGEAFWTMGTERARVLLAPHGRERVNVQVHIGPTGGTCHTTVNGQRAADLPLEPNGTRSLAFAIPTDAAWIPVSVEASNAFRPADVDSQSNDQRLLGCQVRIHW